MIFSEDRFPPPIKSGAGFFRTMLQRLIGKVGSVPKPYPYVYVNADGSARELHPKERQYLEAEYSFGDGAAPYIKDSYAERNGWGELRGYLARSQLPDGIRTMDAPSDDPTRPMGRDEYIAFLRSKGMDVTENPDGSFTASAPR